MGINFDDIFRIFRLGSDWEVNFDENFRWKANGNQF